VSAERPATGRQDGRRIGPRARLLASSRVVRVAAFSAAACIALAIVAARPASAMLVYERTPSLSNDYPLYPIVAARNDGTGARVIAHGHAPQVSPSGRRIAYFVVDKGLYVVGSYGRHRRLLVRRADDTEVTGSIAWSPDERHLIVGRSSGGGAWLVNVASAKATHIRLGQDSVFEDEYGDAGFAPSGERFAICHSAGGHATPELAVVGTDSGHQRPDGNGCRPVWGRAGIAFERIHRLLLRRDVGFGAQTLMRADDGDLLPIAWSANGNRLLVFEERTHPYHAVVVDLKPRRITRSTATFSMVEGLSRDGHEVLGESGGNVVVASVSGTPKVLAYQATRASWTK
jgi:hypothetical protein